MQIDGAGPRRGRLAGGRRLAAVLVALLLAGCAARPVLRSDLDPQADFARYRSFGFVNPSGADNANYSSLVGERVRAAVREQMQSRGYTYTDQSPDLLVNFVADVRQRQEIVSRPPPPMVYGGYRRGFGPWGGYGGWGYNFGWSNEVWVVSEAVLNVDVVDAGRKQMVWQGSSAIVVDNADAAYSPQALTLRVGEVFSQYPFKAGVGATARPTSAPAPAAAPAPAPAAAPTPASTPR